MGPPDGPIRPAMAAAPRDGGSAIPPSDNPAPAFLSRPARVFTIPPARPFVETLADALIDGTLAGPATDPLALADATVYVPTRRAARALGQALVDRLGGEAAILPAIRPLGDVEEDLIALDGPADGRHPSTPAADALGRRLAMTELVLGWSRALSDRSRAFFRGETIAVPTSAADAARLADDLLRLMDQVTTEEASWDGLADLVPEDLADYWQITTAFLSVATRAWPDILAERGLADPVARRIALLKAEAARLERTPPQAPVIAAGSTGSVPATAALLALIARLPRGAVVLPGLDQGLDETSWRRITEGDGAPSHPQFGLARLIDRIGIPRETVAVLGASAEDLAKEPSSDAARPSAIAIRGRLVSEAFRPAETTDGWAGVTDRLGGPAAVEAALDGISLIEAANDREEALAVAIAMREAVERGETVALVAPDRAIARRVQSELARWSLKVDDSAGIPLSQTPAGILARLVAEVGVVAEDPHAILALLKHPLTGLGLGPGAARAAAERLELAVMRGPRLAPGFEPVIAAAAGKDAGAAAIARRAAEALEPLAALAREGSATAAAFAAAHLLALQAVVGGEPAPSTAAGESAATDPAAAVPPALAADRAWRTLVAALERIAAEEAGGPQLRSDEWPALFTALVGDAAVRPAGAGDPRIHIWGALEARLQRADLVILSGLNEGVWPRLAEADPWLTRSMRTRLGLEPPERRIGLSAHDVTQSFGAARVVIARAERIGTTPTVASRWLLRLKAVAGEGPWQTARARGARWLDLARALDRPAGPPVPAERPNPVPPLEARPARLSVTEIETLIRDPYAIYARRILNLKPLEPVADDPGGAERGTMIHEAVAAFFETAPDRFDEAAVARLVEAGRTAFRAIEAYPEVVALWWPRFERVAAALVAEEAKRPRPLRRHNERKGELSIPVSGAGFTLTGRADRIDEFPGGALSVLDYKTGYAPTAKQVASLLAPQLPLEAAMAKRGAFEGVAAGGSVEELAYVGLRGGTPPVTVTPVAPKEGTIDELAGRAFERLVALLGRYRSPGSGYPSRTAIAFEREFAGDYDHLARVREWSLGGGEDS
ncbi:double-strand break repair protein AddB [Pseudoxanthobacter soli]|nr:double-strand break repair protein AddB [Pseudoxanthobacter soli]